jgi:hypothetical protein
MTFSILPPLDTCCSIPPRCRPLDMLALSKDWERRAQWQRACKLLLAEADVDAFSKKVELALFYDVPRLISRRDSISRAFA